MNNIVTKIDNALDNDFVYTKENDRRKNADRRIINSDRRKSESNDFTGTPQRLTIDRRKTTKDRRTAAT